ncbi:hypothetical protein Lal_00036951 [Lupinus albus]|nr:hypothetical protein Lal_00036951 [Lupinus albus]
MNFMDQIPDMARSRVPVHASDRVMRQFGLQQPIPQDPINPQTQHKMDLRGKNDYNWQQKHDQWIQIWNNRENYVVNGLPNIQPLYHYSQYMTRKYISPDGAYSFGSYNFIKSIIDQCASLNVHYNPMQTINDVYIHRNEMIDAFSKLLPTAFSNNNYQAPPTHHFDMPIAPEFQQPYESQTQTNTHPQIFTKQTPAPQQQHFSFKIFITLSRNITIHVWNDFNFQQYYQPTMPTQVEQGNIYDEDEEDDEDEDEEEP